MNNNNIKNAIEGLECTEPSFVCLKEEFYKEHNLRLIQSILFLPCVKSNPNLIDLLIVLLEEKYNDNYIIDEICKTLCSVPLAELPSVISKIKNALDSNYCLSRSALLSMASAAEELFARNMPDTIPLIRSLYERISLKDFDYSPNSEENTRIRCAKIAYLANQYNYREKLDEINSIKSQLKTSGNKNLLGIVLYYKGLCVRSDKNREKNTSYYMLNSRNRGYSLAAVYMNYHN